MTQAARVRPWLPEGRRHTAHSGAGGGAAVAGPRLWGNVWPRAAQRLRTLLCEQWTRGHGLVGRRPPPSSSKPTGVVACLTTTPAPRGLVFPSRQTTEATAAQRGSVIHPRPHNLDAGRGPGVCSNLKLSRPALSCPGRPVPTIGAVSTERGHPDGDLGTEDTFREQDAFLGFTCVLVRTPASGQASLLCKRGRTIGLQPSFYGWG